MSTESETDRGYSAGTIEGNLLSKMRELTCSGEAALEIAKFLLQRLASGESDVEG